MWDFGELQSNRVNTGTSPEAETNTLTMIRRAAQGARTTPEKIALIILGGSFGSGRKVWCSSGRTWKDSSSACLGGGADSGTESSNKCAFKGSWMNEPTMSET